MSSRILAVALPNSNAVRALELSGSWIHFENVSVRCAQSSLRRVSTPCTLPGGVSPNQTLASRIGPGPSWKVSA